MSGGYFDYKEHHINDIASNIAEIIINKSEETDELGYKVSRNYSEVTMQKFREAYFILRKAFEYAHAIDYLLDSDYGEGTFNEVLEEKLSNISKEEEQNNIKTYW